MSGWPDCLMLAFLGREKLPTGFAESAVGLWRLSIVFILLLSGKDSSNPSLASEGSELTLSSSSSKDDRIPGELVVLKAYGLEVVESVLLYTIVALFTNESHLGECMRGANSSPPADPSLVVPESGREKFRVGEWTGEDVYAAGRLGEGSSGRYKSCGL
jgi:hypothetical protein